MDPIKNFRKYLNEEEFPFFNNFEKEVLQYGLDNIENLQPGAYTEEVADEIFNPPGDGIIIYNNEGVEFISKFNDRDGGSGWASGLEYAFDAADEMDNTQYIAGLMLEGNWAGVANYIIMEMGRRLLVASEILAQKIASNDEEMSEEDIEDLKDELELFISG
jgi:hypothetical protein